MKTSKRMFMTISALCMAAALTACGKGSSTSGDNNAEGTTEWYDVSKEGMEEETTTTSEKASSTTETTTEETTETTTATDTDASGGGSSGKNGGKNETDKKDKEKPSESAKEVANDIVVSGKKNTKADGLLYVKVNGYDFDNIWRTQYLDVFLTCADLQQDKSTFHYNPDDDNDGVFWYGNGYSIEGVNGCLYVEVVPCTDSAVSVGDADLSNPDGYYRLRSLYANKDTPEEMEVVFSGVKIGMEKAAVEERFGHNAGNKTNGYTYYANDLGALLLTYDNDDKVEEMYLFIDYERYLKVKYTEE